jgi:hypothetical protein
MSERPEQDQGKLGFLDSVMRLFQRGEAAPAQQAPATATPPAIATQLDAAIQQLESRIAASRSAAAGRGGAGAGARKATAEDRAEASKRRMETAHREMRADIEAMHGRLATGLSGADLDRIAATLRELAALCAPGHESHELLPRARWSIGERLRAEAGEQAIERIVALLRKAQMSWPDPTHYRPGALPEEIERSRSRRLRDVREAFLAQDFAKAADGLLGVVKGWRSDYPDRGTPLWEETVLEGVAAGIRGRLLETFFEVLRRDRDAILAQTDEAIGKELAAVQAVLAGGGASAEQASQAMASYLRVVDTVLPEIAWKHVESQLPSPGA